MGSQEDVSPWVGGMFFLLSIVLPFPLCGLRAGRHQVAWQAFIRAGEHFRRELTCYEWLKLFQSFSIPLDQPDWGSQGEEGLGDGPLLAAATRLRVPGTLADPWLAKRPFASA